MRINFLTEEGGNLYESSYMREILGVNKSKLHREIQKLSDKNFVKYKNRHLYKENTLLQLMETILFQRLDKIEKKL